MAKKDLDEKGKHVSTYKVDIINTSGEICAVVKLHSHPDVSKKILSLALIYT